MRVGLLISGGLGLEALKLVSSIMNPVFVFTDKSSSGIIDYCIDASIPNFVGNPRNGAAMKFLRGRQVDVILSVNYLFLIEKDILGFPSKYCINIHGSLLPKYRGRTPHVWSIINNEKYAGITAHFIDENCDTGAIIKQQKIEITEYDTGASLLEKYKPLYLKMIADLLIEAKEDKLIGTAQDESKATYFNKRTPDDGAINWDWQKERIRNWVRAQAYPYPGAFTVINGQRIIIDEIVYSDMGFTQDMPNGLVLATSPLLVKTQNGVVEITKIREGKDLIVIGKVL